MSEESRLVLPTDLLWSRPTVPRKSKVLLWRVSGAQDLQARRITIFIYKLAKKKKIRNPLCAHLKTCDPFGQLCPMFFLYVYATIKTFLFIFFGAFNLVSISAREGPTKTCSNLFDDRPLTTDYWLYTRASILLCQKKKKKHYSSSFYTVKCNKNR